jgi:hypothetical protein
MIEWLQTFAASCVCALIGFVVTLVVDRVIKFFGGDGI